MKTCIPICEKSPEKLFEKIKEYSSQADIIELWLGEIFTEEYNFETFGERFFEDLKKVKTECANVPFLINVKDEKEKGSFAGTEIQKYNILKSSLSIGCEYVDVDYQFDQELVLKLKQKTVDFKAKLILSAHFFEGTPTFPSLKNRIQKMQNSRADIVKIAAMPESPKDTLTVLRLAENLQRKDIPFIAISMGKIGKISRILGPLWGSEIAFIIPKNAPETAPGQMQKDEFDDAFTMFS